VSESGTESALKLIDWLIIGAYFLFVVWLGSRFGKRQTSSERYFLGNRRLPGWAVGMSIFATIISSWSFLGLPGKSFASDMQYVMTIALIPLTVCIAVFFLIPLFRRKIKLSAYEYLERRFGPFARFYADILFIAGHFFKMSMVLYLMCLALEGVTGWHVLILIVIVGVATTIYTFFGGIEGVVWTDVTQGFLLLAGGILSLYFLLFKSPVSAGEVLAVAREAGKFKLVSLDFGWNKLSVFLLLFFGFNHYLAKYTTDQTVVQRYLLAPSSKQASRALWISVLFLGIVWVMFMTVGALLWVFYKTQPDLLPAAVRAKPDQVLAYFIGHQLPAGVTGLILAGIFAASMSTLSSDLNSLASILAEDFYSKIVKGGGDRRRLLFSRISVLAAGFLSIFLAMLLTKVQSIVDAFFTFSAIIAGGMVGMFFLGLLTRRTSSKGLYIGLAIGVTFIVWAALTKSQAVSEALPQWLPRYGIHIYWLGLLGNLVVFVAGYAASVAFSPGHKAEDGLTIYKSKTAGADDGD
jgi:SSS family solute:Na+ symporter